MKALNSYESGKQKIIPAVLIYAFFKNQVLMIHRNLNPNDFHQDKWNGLGGKLDYGETFVQAASREFTEEATVEIPMNTWHWCGQLYFPNFKPHKNEDWLVNIFTVNLSPEQALMITKNKEANQEGSLHFIDQEKILDLNLWDGDRHFLPKVLNGSPFTGTFFYENGKCSRFELKDIFCQK